MKTTTRLTLLATALAVSNAAWAATGNVDVYGQITIPVAPLPTHQTYSAASTLGGNLFDPVSTFVPQTDITTVSNATAQIGGTGYAATARTTQGSNHAYTSVAAFPSGGFGVASFSGWHDQVTISGSTGTGTLQFSVNLSGNVTVGAYAGVAGFGLLASNTHPTQLVSDTLIFNVLNTEPWALDSNQVTEIALYDILASPYNDPSQSGWLSPPKAPESSIFPITDPSNSLGNGDLGFPEYVPDLVLTPGANQSVNVMLTGTVTFTYGEAFYLIGALGTSVVDLSAFVPFCAAEPCPESPVIDGTGPTTLDFANSAQLVSIVLPQGASFASASGAAYNVTAVPEPGEWLLMLAGLGLLGWRVRRRA